MTQPFLILVVKISVFLNPLWAYCTRSRVMWHSWMKRLWPLDIKMLFILLMTTLRYEEFLENTCNSSASHMLSWEDQPLGSRYMLFNPITPTLRSPSFVGPFDTSYSSTLYHNTFRHLINFWHQTRFYPSYIPTLPLNSSLRIPTITLAIGVLRYKN